MRSHRLLAPLLAGTLLFAACGDDDTETTTDDSAELPVNDGDAAPPAAGACLEGEPDCQDTGATPPPGPIPGEDDPTFDESEDPAVSGPAEGGDDAPADTDYDARAEELLGTPEDELPADVRVSRRGDESYALTEDYVVGRATVELDLDPELDQYVVTTVVFETDDGPKTYGAEA